MMFKVLVTLLLSLVVLENVEGSRAKRAIVNIIEFVKEAKQICSDMTADGGQILNADLEKKYFDKNGDDTISSEDLSLLLNERNVGMEGYMTKIFDMHDLNKDGKVSMDEYTTKIAAADDDHDGKISMKECIAYELDVYQSAGGD